MTELRLGPYRSLQHPLYMKVRLIITSSIESDLYIKLEHNAQSSRRGFLGCDPV